MKQQWTILEESSHWLAINKPSSLNVETVWDYPSVEKQVYQYLKRTGRREDPYLGIVHRLDRPVSGVLLLAKKKSSLRFFNRQFAEGRTQKTYWAVCEGAPPQKQGVLEHHLLKDQKQKRSFVFPVAKKGTTPVKLSYRVIQQEVDRCWLEVRPHSGKYHQIRVQLAAMGCPILGDVKYGSQQADEEDCIALHARSLRILNPLNEQEQLQFEAPAPERKAWQKG